MINIERVTKDFDIGGGISYERKELAEYKKYYGRVMVKYHKAFQTQGIYYKKICDELVVNQILPAIVDGYDFPGYDKVRLSFE